MSARNTRPDRFNPARYGGWKFNRLRLTVTFQKPIGNEYEVDLEEMTTSAQILDWIMQINTKAWATPAVMSGFVRLINTLLKPQHYYCGSGVEHGPRVVKDVIYQTMKEDAPAPKIVHPVGFPERIQWPLKNGAPSKIHLLKERTETMVFSLCGNIGPSSDTQFGGEFEYGHTCYTCSKIARKTATPTDGGAHE